MTITQQFVSMVQTKAMQGIVQSIIILPVVFGFFIATVTGWINLVILDEDKWNCKLFLIAWFFCVVAIAILMLPSTVSDYLLWRDFPAQMIIDKLI